MPDEQVLFLSDIFPTGYMAAEMCDIKPGDIIAVWGCGPVGQFAIKSAYLLGAERVIAIDRFPYRLRMAREKAGAETINYEEVDVYDDAQGDDRRPRARMPASTRSAWRRTRPAPIGAYDRVKQAMMLETDRPARAARGDHGLPQRRHRLGHRRLRRLHRQVPDGLGHEPVADDQDRADATSSAT